MVLIVAILALIAVMLLFGRWAVMATIFFTVVWGLSNFAHAEAIGSFTTAPVTVMCPNPEMTAYLESHEAPPHFSKEWEYTAGHAHCRTVKNDRPLIVIKTGSFTFHSREYDMVELIPGGVTVSVDGFGGPYYLLASRLKKLPTVEQMHTNVAALLPTRVDYSIYKPMGAMPGDSPSATTAPPAPTAAAPVPNPEPDPKPESNAAAAL